MKSTLKLTILALAAGSLTTGSAIAQRPATILGKTNTQGLFESVPAPPNSPAEAATRAYGPDIRMYDMPVKLDSLYSSFFERAATAHEQLKSAIAARQKEMPDQATVERQAKAQANSNPIVAGMGGTDKIQQMDAKQREQAARQSVAAYQQNLVTGGGRNSASMQAMMQRVMSDPEYRARFTKMSEAEKEAEMRKNMGEVRAPTAEDRAHAQQSRQTGNEVATTMAIREELNRMVQRLGEIDAEFAQKDQVVATAPGSHEQIASEINAKIAKVPIVELGEYGHDRDPVQVQALLREQATRDRTRAAWELGQRNGLFAQRKARYKEVATAYDVWLKQNLGRINTSLADPLRGTNTELAVAGYEDGLIGLSEDLAKYSEDATKNAASYEKRYQQALDNGGGSPARAKKAGK